ncbi:MAG: glycosyltransferase [Candidatus Omnitrophica bacterium]|nr:glycosyltransferase [Candidatus Omnitrophota bacterium]
MGMKRVAMVSPYFPPSTLAGVHRARLLAKHLNKFSWEPVVFCVDEHYHEQSLDLELEKLVPKTIRVIKSKAFRIQMTRLFGVGDIGLRGYRGMYQALEDFLGREKADLLFITLSPYYPSLMGPSLKRKFKLPFILDYQDPWVSKFGARQPIFTKAGLSHILAKWLEPKVLRWADHITSVSEGTNQEIRMRYPKLNKDIFSVLPIGGDPEDYEYLESHPFPLKIATLSDKELNFCYVGTLLPRAHRTLRALLKAIKIIREKNPTLYQKMKFHFIGTSNLPDGFKDFKVLPMAREEGVEERIREIPERVPYLEALKILSSSNVILMLGSDEKHYTASKLFPGLLSGRPILALYHEASSVCEIVKQTGGVHLIKFSDEVPAQDQVGNISKDLELLALHPEVVQPASLDAMKSVLASSIAGQFAKLFDSVVSRGPSQAAW